MESQYYKPGNGTTAIKVEWSPEVYRRNNNGPKTLFCGTPDTTLTSLLLQPSVITGCDRFDRNCVNIHNTETPIHTEQSLYRIPWWLTLWKAALKSICTTLPPAHSPMHFAVHATRTKVYHRHPDFSDKQTGWLKHTTAFHKSSEAIRHQALKHLGQYRCCENRSVIGNRGGWWTLWNRWHWPVSSKLGNYPDEQAAETLH